MDLTFLQIHILAARAQAEPAPGLSHDPCGCAVEALQIMAQHKALHPAAPALVALLEGQNHPESATYSPEWVQSLGSDADVKPAESSSSGLELPRLASGKDEHFAEFWPRFARLFIQADFQNVAYLLNKLNLLVAFLGHCSDAGMVARNRYFEYLLCQMATSLNGLLWFPQSAPQANPNGPNDPPAPESWHTIEQQCLAYFDRCSHVLEAPVGLPEVHTETHHALARERNYYWSVRWLCALAKLKENRVAEFIADLRALQNHLDLLPRLGLHETVVLLCVVATAVTVPLLDLALPENEALLDSYLSNSAQEDLYHDFVAQLASADYKTARTTYEQSLVPAARPVADFAVAPRTHGTFWDYVAFILDAKMFLRILAMSLRVPVPTVLDLMGYDGSPDSVRAAKADVLPLVVAVLGLVEDGVLYEPDTDSFVVEVPSEATRVARLQEKVAHVDHIVRSEAVAAHIKSLLVNKYCS